MIFAFRASAYTTYLIQMGDYQMAGDILMGLLDDKRYHQKSEIFAQMLNNFGLVLYHYSEYDSAKEYFQYSLEIFHSIGSTDYHSLALGYSNLAAVNISLDDYAEVESYFNNSLYYFEKSGALLSLNCSGLYSQMALYCSNIAMSDRAYIYSKKALDIIRDVQGENGMDYSMQLSNHASALLRLDRFDDALDTAKVAYNLMKKNDYLTTTYGVNVVNTLALLAEDYESKFPVDNLMAESYFQLALELAKEVSGEKSLIYIIVLNNLSQYYAVNGRHDEAKRLTRQLLDLSLPVLGENHIDYFSCHHNAAMSFNAMEEASEAELYLSFYLYNIKRKTNVYSTFFSSQQRMSFWNKYIGFTFLRTVPSFGYEYVNNHPEYAGIEYDNALFSKGYLLGVQNLLQHVIANSNDSEVIAKWDSLCHIKQRLIDVQFYAKGANSDTLQLLKDREEQLDKDLVLLNKQYSDNKRNIDVSWRDIQRQLKPNEVAVEFLHFDYWHDGQYCDSILYSAVLLRADRYFPIYLSLFEEKELLPLLSAKADLVYEENVAEIYQKVWQPLTKYINPRDKVFFSPSGVLHNLNFEALRNNKGEFLDEIYDFERLSSTRQLVLRDNSYLYSSYFSGVEAVLYGGINYDVDTLTMKRVAENYNIGGGNLASRAVGLDSLRAGVAFLSGTIGEIGEIDSLLTVRGCSTIVLNGDSANEESFKALSGGDTKLLHIATHGFYMSNDEAINHKYYNFMRQQSSGVVNEIDPLLRLGLLFAGANRAYTGNISELPDEVDDGILISQEVSFMDLSSVDLLVLSACQTAVGSINNEGVFGLQRAFKQAGVRSIVMSLWKVDDFATKLFMTSFYHSLAQGVNRHEAFKIARSTVRAKFPEPYYWAAFVMLD